MKWFKPPKAWQKIAPDTIEAWLVSDDPREQRLADEALTRLGPVAASDYLQHLLLSEYEILSRRLGFVRNVCLTLLGVLLVVTFVTKQDGPLMIGLVALSVIAIIMSSFQQMTTDLQERAVEQAIMKNDVLFIGILLKSLTMSSSIPFNIAVRTHLPALMNRITVDNKNLVLEEHWSRFVDALDEISKKKKILFIPVEQEFSLAIIRMCGNVRHEPALPALRALAARDADTPQAREIKELSARYVAEWDTLPANIMETVAAQTEKPPVPLRLNAL